MLAQLSHETLKRLVQPSDLRRRDCVLFQDTADTLADRSWAAIDSNFADLELDSIRVKGRPAYCIRSTHHLILLRWLNGTLQRISGIRPADRDLIARNLSVILAEGVPQRVYKFDVMSFFESIDVKYVYETLVNTSAIPRAAIRIIGSFFNALGAEGVIGLPRGVPLSSTLSEYILQDFDAAVSSLRDVYYHARYVDDIIIVTGGRETPTDFSRTIRSLLPCSLRVNPSKTKLVDLPLHRRLTRNGPSTSGEFDYLGYHFMVNPPTQLPDRRLIREVNISIAQKKIKRIKSRLCHTVMTFLQDNDLSTLEQRLKLITGNHNLRDYTTGTVRNAGFYCTYRRINSINSLNELDRFWRAITVGSHNPLARRLAQVLPLSERQELLRFSFTQSFERKVFYNFRSSDLATLAGCWRNV